VIALNDESDPFTPALGAVAEPAAPPAPTTTVYVVVPLGLKAVIFSKVPPPPVDSPITDDR
jgi:hypothetical protein